MTSFAATAPLVPASPEPTADQADKIVSHEDAAHEKRNWVRLTFECNNRCVFCLDSDTHDGRMRDKEEVKAQILDGKKAGATRLILSGGEPTIHPNYVDFIKLGARAGYKKIQTVTNGRLFQYQEYLDRCLEAGLDEITFSLHGPNARIHDALVGVKGAFEQESAGLRRAVETRNRTGRPIVNVDIVINKANVKHLTEMLDLFMSWGVLEFDLLQVIPFGRAFTEGRTTLFYDLEEMQPYLRAAFEYTKKPGVHIWINRFPPPHMEGFEHLIQDPYKLNDEVRGRKEEYAKLLGTGEDLVCREKEGRCRYCYLEQLCNQLYDVKDALEKGEFARVRLDTEAEKTRPVVFGGDPASAKRAVHFGGPDVEEHGHVHGDDGHAHGENGNANGDGREKNGTEKKAPKRGLPILGGSAAAAAKRISARPLAERLAAARVKRGWIVAPDLAAARAALAERPELSEVELDLERHEGLLSSMQGGALEGRRVLAVVARTPAEAEALLAAPEAFEVIVRLSQATAPWLLRLDRPAARLVLLQPTHEKLTESQTDDVALRPFFESFRHAVPVIGVPACILGRAPREEPATLDAAMLDTEGALEVFRYTRRHIEAGYFTKALRCNGCAHTATCRGLHVNYVRAHGYAELVPVAAPSAAAVP